MTAENASHHAQPICSVNENRIVWLKERTAALKSFHFLMETSPVCRSRCGTGISKQRNFFLAAIPERITLGAKVLVGIASKISLKTADRIRRYGVFTSHTLFP